MTSPPSLLSTHTNDKRHKKGVNLLTKAAFLSIFDTHGKISLIHSLTRSLIPKYCFRKIARLNQDQCHI